MITVDKRAGILQLWYDKGFWGAHPPPGKFAYVFSMRVHVKVRSAMA